MSTRRGSSDRALAVTALALQEEQDQIPRIADPADHQQRQGDRESLDRAGNRFELQDRTDDHQQIGEQWADPVPEMIAPIERLAVADMKHVARGIAEENDAG